MEATLRYHLNKEGFDIATMIFEGSDIATMTFDNNYVDNLSVGASSVQEPYNIYEQAKQIFVRPSINIT